MSTMIKIADFQESFEAIEGLSLETSYGRIRQEDDIVLCVTIGYTAEKEYGWFEFYDEKSGGEDWYAEGGLWFSNNELTDYDGVFALPSFVLDYLEKKGFNVEDMR